MDKFKIGDKIYKPSGYKFPGTVVSVFKNLNGDTRIVAELEDNGMLHIFTEGQLELKEQPEKKETLYYIQNGYVGNAVCWWGKDSKGYTCDFTKAGKYTKEDALHITKRPQDIAWECDYVDRAMEAHKLIIDGQYLNGEHSIVGNLK